MNPNVVDGQMEASLTHSNSTAQVSSEDQHLIIEAHQSPENIYITSKVRDESKSVTRVGVVPKHSTKLGMQCNVVAPQLTNHLQPELSFSEQPSQKVTNHNLFSETFEKIKSTTDESEWGEREGTPEEKLLTFNQERRSVTQKCCPTLGPETFTVDTNLKKVSSKTISSKSKSARIHTREKLYECEVCIKTFTSIGNLNTHRRIHKGEKRYHCEICMKKFSAQSSLKTHARIHTGEKPYKCEMCKKTFSQESNLKTHARIHTGKKPYHCEICMKTFSHYSTLKTHARIHTGEKPYQCEICMKTFSQEIYLKTHVRIHTGEKPYECEICMKKFSVQSNLKSHARIHTEEKPYQCEICMKTFSQESKSKKPRCIHT